MRGKLNNFNFYCSAAWQLLWWLWRDGWLLLLGVAQRLVLGAGDWFLWLACRP